MERKVELVYENNEYSVAINGSIIEKNIGFEKALEKFKSVIDNNKSSEAKAWADIVEKFETLNNSNLEINNEFRTMAFQDIKYFYNMGKTFYMGEGQMVPLIGGYNLFKFILFVVSNQGLDITNKFNKFCKKLMFEDVNYRITDSSIIISSASFNYGSAEYNFLSKKINKGASIIEGSFDEFEDYVFSIIKKK